MKFIPIFLLWLMSGTTLSQIVIKNNSLIYPEKRIAYYGLYNSIEINGIETDSTTYLISGLDTVKRSSLYETFFYKPRLISKDTLVLFHKNEKVDTFIFRLDHLGVPKVFFGTSRDSTVSKKYLLTNPGLIASYEPKFAKCDLHILDFEASIIIKGGDTLNIRNLNNNTNGSDDSENTESTIRYFSPSKFSKMELDIIRDAEEGDIIWFSRVVWRSPDSRSAIRDIDLKLIITDN